MKNEMSDTWVTIQASKQSAPRRRSYFCSMVFQNDELVLLLMRGGKREGAGRPPGATTRKAARDVVKQVRWTAEEWAEVERLAEAAGLTASDLVRRATLGR